MVSQNPEQTTWFRSWLTRPPITAAFHFGRSSLLLACHQVLKGLFMVQALIFNWIVFKLFPRNKDSSGAKWLYKGQWLSEPITFFCNWLLFDLFQTCLFSTKENSDMVHPPHSVWVRGSLIKFTYKYPSFQTLSSSMGLERPYCGNDSMRYFIPYE